MTSIPNASYASSDKQDLLMLLFDSSIQATPRKADQGEYKHHSKKPKRDSEEYHAKKQLADQAHISLARLAAYGVNSNKSARD
jgi:hypothetical protein